MSNIGAHSLWYASCESNREPRGHPGCGWRASAAKWRRCGVAGGAARHRRADIWKECGMSIGQTQVFLLAVGITAVVGWVRGWQREVITCAIVLATVLFLSLGLGDALAQLFTHGSQSLIPTASAHPF